jgi:Ca2+/H+ antiporter
MFTRRPSSEAYDYLIVAAINLNDGETNAIEGMTHFVLFGTFLALTLLGIAAG